MISLIRDLRSDSDSNVNSTGFGIDFSLLDFGRWETNLLFLNVMIIREAEVH